VPNNYIYNEEIPSWEEVFSEMLDQYDEMPEKFAEYLRIDNNIEMDRFDLIMSMLEQGKGYQETEKLLHDRNMRSLYPRSISEFVLIYCLNYNDYNDQKYNITKYRTLLARIKVAINYPKIVHPQPMPKTLKGLRKIINDNVNKKRDDKTLERTIFVKRKLEEIDYTSVHTEEKLEELAHTFCSIMVNAHESTRYYIAKYLYWVICCQLIEMQQVVFYLRKNYSSGSDKSTMIKYLQELTETTSISERYCSYLYRLSGDQDIELIFDCYPDEKLDTRISQKTANSEKKGLTFEKCLMRAFCRNHVLFKDTSLREKTFLLHPDRPEFHPKQAPKNETPEQATKRQEKEQKAQEKIQKQQELYDGFSNNIISLFESRNIDYSKLFSYVFYLSENMLQSIDTQQRKNFMTAILRGKANISRNTFICFLISCRSAIDCDVLDGYQGSNKENLIGFNKITDGLSLSTVNHIMERVGYPTFQVKDDIHEEDIRADIAARFSNQEYVHINLDNAIGFSFYQKLNDQTIIRDLINSITDYYEDHGTFIAEDLTLLNVTQIIGNRRNNHA